MLHAAHFAIYLQGREQQLGSWQLAEPFALRCNGETSTEWENWSSLWIWGVLGFYSEAIPVEGLKAL